jgi:hypothetical protein
MASVFQLHVPNSIWAPADQADGPSVGIRLGQHGYAIDGSIIVGPLMSSPTEVDRTVDALIAELESIRKQAKRELAGG